MTPLAVENSVGKLAAAEMWRQMPARERELGELPSPIWSLLDRKVGQGLDAYRPGDRLMDPRTEFFGLLLSSLILDNEIYRNA